MLKNIFKRDRYRFLNMYHGYVGNLSHVFDSNYWSNHPDPAIRSLYIELTMNVHNEPKPDMITLTKMVRDAIHHLKLKHVLKLIKSNSQAVKHAAIEGSELTPLIQERMRLDSIKVSICKELGIDIIS